MNLISVDICSGAGGLAAGLSQSKFQTKLVCDFDRDSCETLGKNKSRLSGQEVNLEFKKNDIREIDFTEIEGSVDLVSGGPPCQPFSKGGKHSAHLDQRDLFPEAIRAVREIRPKAYLFENVGGLQRPNFVQYFEYLRLQLTHPDIEKLKGETWLNHLRRLESHHISGSRDGLNYRLIVHKLNAADYGIPQQRNRIFFVGFREDLEVDWCFPNPTHSKIALAATMNDGIYWEKNKVPMALRDIPRAVSSTQSYKNVEGLCPWVTLRDAISDLPDPREHSHSKNPLDPLHVFRNGAKSYKGHTGSRLDEPAKTLKAGVHGVPGGENMFINDDDELRYFTLRECARIQTFPDDYVFAGAWSSILKQMGNAVPVKLSQIIGSSIAEALACHNTEVK